MISEIKARYLHRQILFPKGNTVFCVIELISIQVLTASEFDCKSTKNLRNYCFQLDQRCLS